MIIAGYKVKNTYMYNNPKKKNVWAFRIVIWLTFQEWDVKYLLLFQKYKLQKVSFKAQKYVDKNY